MIREKGTRKKDSIEWPLTVLKFKLNFIKYSVLKHIHTAIDIHNSYLHKGMHTLNSVTFEFTLVIVKSFEFMKRHTDCRAHFIEIMKLINTSLWMGQFFLHRLLWIESFIFQHSIIIFSNGKQRNWMRQTDMETNKKRKFIALPSSRKQINILNIMNTEHTTIFYALSIETHHWTVERFFLFPLLSAKSTDPP